MRKTVHIFLIVQFIIFFQNTIFFLKPFDISIDTPVGSTLSTLITVSSLLVSIIFCLSNRAFAIALFQRMRIIGGITLLCGLSLIWSVLPANGSIKLVNLVLQLFQVTGILIACVSYRLNLYEIIKKATFIAVALNVAYYFVDRGGALSKTLGEDGRYECLAPQPNSLGQLAILTYIIWLPWSVRALRPIHLAALALSVFCISLSDSSTGLLVIALASLLKLTYLFRKQTSLLILATLAVLMGGVYISGNSLFKSVGRDSSLTGRTFIWEYAVHEQQRAGKEIAGFGLGGFWDPSKSISHTEDFLEGFMQAHNGYLDIYLQLGWLGLLLCAAMLIATILLIRKYWLIDTYNNLCILLIAILVNNITESSLVVPKHPFWLVFILLYTVLASRFPIFASQSLYIRPRVRMYQPFVHPQA